MTTAREVMNAGATCINEDQTLLEAARMMRDLGVGSLPICGNDKKLHGIITGLARVRTLETSGDGLHRLLIAFREAKVRCDRIASVTAHSSVSWNGLTSSTTSCQSRCTPTSDCRRSYVG